MARVTVEDCVEKVSNRFELVMFAAQRARDISRGAPLRVERDRDKNPVVALREIADAHLDLDTLENSIIKSMQHRVEPDHVDEEDVTDLMASEQHSWVVGEATESVFEDADELDDDTALDDSSGDEAGSDVGDDAP